MTGGKGVGQYYSTLVVAQTYPGAITRVVGGGGVLVSRRSFGGECPLRHGGYLNGTLSGAPTRPTCPTCPMRYLYRLLSW